MQENIPIVNYKKEKRKKSFLKIINKKIKNIKSSYILTYKSLNTKKITIFWSLIIIGIIFILLSINTLSNQFIIEVPTYGGTWNEGILGTPRYINPVLATSEADKDLTSLIYSGLLKKDKDGNMITDVADNIEESDDNLTYTVSIDDNAKFQDGKKITADDIIFTISKIQDKNIDSPLAINFEGVSVEKVNDKTIIFHLKRPYYYFDESLDFGILPKHIWGDVSDEEFSLADYNTNPIGSGPYKISNVVKSSNLIKEYKLSSFKDYLLGRPFIDYINIFTYSDEKALSSALLNNEIDATGYLPASYYKNINIKNINIISSTLPNLFSLSFNPTKNNLFSTKQTRSGLSTAIDKQNIINTYFDGYARKMDYVFQNTNNSTYDNSEMKNQIINNQKIINSTTSGVYISRIDIAKNLLGDTLKNKNIQITITTADVEDLKNTANEIAKNWQNLGINVNTKIYSLADIVDIIKNRNFEVLLFGSIINHDTDLYAYWHSSQRNYPGLNITGYASKKLDTNLEILKSSLDNDERKSAIDSINKELSDENQSIPIYSNNFNYLINDKLKEEIIKDYIPTTMQDPSERYQEISDWYIYKEKVWKFSYMKDLEEKLENIIH
ncbi:MAG: ABC transporter substrate-binding protein [Candidatus Nomurabacteria bacterium]